MKIKATVISPIHIGTSEMYEPTNFIIDGDYLYYFKEEDFYKKLPKSDKGEFLRLAESNVIGLWKFVANRKGIAKEISKYKVKVTSGLKEHYEKALGKPTQISRSNQKTFNQFMIQKAVRTPTKKRLYIPGSSIKGAINTALEEKYKWYEDSKYHKEILISDARGVKIFELIGYAVNKERFEDDMIGPKTLIEVIMSTPSDRSEFIFDIDFKRYGDVDKHIEIKDIIKACNAHYEPLFRSMFEDEEIKRVLGSKFKATYENLKLRDNQFLLRVGKHSGARAVTIEEKRKILVKIAEIQNKRGEADFGGTIRVRRMYKKSEYESDKLEDLMVDFSKLSDNEKRIMRTFEQFYFEPEKLENLVRRKKRLTINAILKEETTTWVFGYKNKLEENRHLPFGWVLCEIVE
ncbi:MAG: RAMP superfamily CRISPR-associated protein [Nautiliaceae bacterium]